MSRFDIIKPKTSSRFNTTNTLATVSPTANLLKDTITGLPQAAFDVAKSDLGLISSSLKSTFPGVFERVGQVKQAIQGNTEPLKQGMKTQWSEANKPLVTTGLDGKPTLDKEVAQKAIDLAWGFVGASGRRPRAPMAEKVIEKGLIPAAENIAPQVERLAIPSKTGQPTVHIPEVTPLKYENLIKENPKLSPTSMPTINRVYTNLIKAGETDMAGVLTSNPRESTAIQMQDELNKKIQTPEQKAATNFKEIWDKQYGNRPSTIEAPTQLQQRTVENKPLINQPISPAREEAKFQVQTLLDEAKAGTRIFKGTGVDSEVYGVRSTFPEFIPEDLRSKKLFDKVTPYVDSGEKPATARLGRLFDVIEKEIAAREANIAEKNAPIAEPIPVQQPVIQAQAAQPFQQATTNPEVQLPPPPQSRQEQILSARDMKASIEKSNEKAPLPEDYPTQAAEIRNLLKQKLNPNDPNSKSILENITNFRDISNTQKGFKDPYRLFEQVFQEYFPIIENGLLRDFDAAKGNFINFQDIELADYKRIIDSKFKEGSPEDMSIRLYGENKIGLNDLVEKFGQQKADEIVAAERWFRNKYDTYLDALNKVEMQIYPNSPYKWTPKRADYFRHGWELGNSFSRLQNILENPIEINPLLAGKTDITKPKSRWASFKQQRQTDETKLGAMRGYLDYLPSLSYATNIDPFIGKFRELGEAIRRAEAANGTENLNNFTDFLEKYSNSLAGKTIGGLDQLWRDWAPGGRTSLEVVTLINNRIKSNTVVGNISSSLAQVSNIPQGITAAGKINAARGLAQTLGQNFVTNDLMQLSNFLPERYFKGYEQFDKKFLDAPKKMGTWMLTVLDEAGTKFIWNSMASKAMNDLGITNPADIARYADVATRKLVGGRGIGEKSLMQSSKVFQILAPFQLEVTNFWYVMKDLYKDNPGMLSKLDKFMTLFVIVWLFNNKTEKMTGNRLIMDPIDATVDGINMIKQDPSVKGWTSAGGRLAGEALGNIPFGQTIAAQYNEYGYPSLGLPSRKKLFGDEDPTRFGTGFTVTKGLTDPLFKVLPAYGGAQIKKTLQGLSAVAAGKVTDKNGDIQYRVDQTPMNIFKGAVFGKQGLPETQAYYNKTPKKPNRFSI